MFNYNPADQIVTRIRNNDAYVCSDDVDGSRTDSFNGLNHYLTAGSARLAYDPSGNLTSDGATSYTYYLGNRLVAAAARGPHLSAKIPTAACSAFRTRSRR